MTRILTLTLSAVLVALAAIAPVGLALWLAHADIRERAEHDLAGIAEFLARDSATLLRAVDGALDALADLDTACAGEDLQRLRAVAFDLPEVSEAGVVTADGLLVCTSWGPVVPPQPVGVPPPGERLRLVHNPRVKVMKRPAVIAARTRADGSEINALLPERVLVGALATELGEQGFSALVEIPARRVVLSSSPVPPLELELNRRELGPTAVLLYGRFGDGVERTVAASALEGYPNLVAVAAVPDDWIYQDWLEEALPVAILGLVTAVFLVVLVVRLTRRRLSLRGELERALRAGEFEVHYQPVMALDSGACVGAEALLRWRHPEQGLLYPDHFIHLAEDTGIIEPITEWLLRRVAADLGTLLAPRPDLHLSINLCARHFEWDRILHETEAAFAGSGIRPDQVVYEITERTMVCEKETPAADIMHSLRRRPSRIALDDFGTGHSCLSYLNHFPLDYLKIDKQFVASIGTDAVTAGLVDSIIDIARKMGLELVAEGVETQAQADYLRDAGVEYAQGYLFSRALPADGLAAFLERADAALHANPQGENP